MGAVDGRIRRRYGWGISITFNSSTGRALRRATAANVIFSLDDERSLRSGVFFSSVTTIHCPRSGPWSCRSRENEASARASLDPSPIIPSDLSFGDLSAQRKSPVNIPIPIPSISHCCRPRCVEKLIHLLGDSKPGTVPRDRVDLRDALLETGPLLIDAGARQASFCVADLDETATERVPQFSVSGLHDAAVSLWLEALAQRTEIATLLSALRSARRPRL